MAALVDACQALAVLVKSDDPRDWPVLHMPPHANTFPLAYVYSCLLLIRTGKLSTTAITPATNPPPAPIWADAHATPLSDKDIEKLKDRFPDILEEKIRTKEWGDDPPKLERNARFNIFFANEEQTKLWGGLETFHSSKIFNYQHRFFLAKETDTSIKDWVKNNVKESTQIRIVTDIPAQAALLRNDILTELAKFGKHCGSIKIVSSSSRSPSDVLQWAFVDDPIKNPNSKIMRVFLFGTPLCRILSEKYNEINYDKEVLTYLCIQASDPSEGWLPVLPIYQFFKNLGYQTNPDPKKEIPLPDNPEFNAIADNFRRCMETKLPAIEEQKFCEQFRISISKHCFLVQQKMLF